MSPLLRPSVSRDKECWQVWDTRACGDRGDAGVQAVLGVEERGEKEDISPRTSAEIRPIEPVGEESGQECEWFGPLLA